MELNRAPPVPDDGKASTKAQKRLYDARDSVVQLLLDLEAVLASYDPMDAATWTTRDAAAWRLDYVTRLREVMVISDTLGNDAALMEELKGSHAAIRETVWAPVFDRNDKKPVSDSALDAQFELLLAKLAKTTERRAEDLATGVTATLIREAEEQAAAIVPPAVHLLWRIGLVEIYIREQRATPPTTRAEQEAIIVRLAAFDDALDAEREQLRAVLKLAPETLLSQFGARALPRLAKIDPALVPRLVADTLIVPAATVDGKVEVPLDGTTLVLAAKAVDKMRAKLLASANVSVEKLLLELGAVVARLTKTSASKTYRFANAVIPIRHPPDPRFLVKLRKQVIKPLLAIEGEIKRAEALDQAGILDQDRASVTGSLTGQLGQLQTIERVAIPAFQQNAADEQAVHLKAFLAECGALKKRLYRELNAFRERFPLLTVDELLAGKTADLFARFVAKNVGAPKKKKALTGFAPPPSSPLPNTVPSNLLPRPDDASSSPLPPGAAGPAASLFNNTAVTRALNGVAAAGPDTVRAAAAAVTRLAGAGSTAAQLAEATAAFVDTGTVLTDDQAAGIAHLLEVLVDELGRNVTAPWQVTEAVGVRIAHMERLLARTAGSSAQTTSRSDLFFQPIVTALQEWKTTMNTRFETLLESTVVAVETLVRDAAALVDKPFATLALWLRAERLLLAPTASSIRSSPAPAGSPDAARAVRLDAAEDALRAAVVAHVTRVEHDYALIAHAPAHNPLETYRLREHANAFVQSLAAGGMFPAEVARLAVLADALAAPMPAAGAPSVAALERETTLLWTRMVQPGPTPAMYAERDALIERVHVLSLDVAGDATARSWATIAYNLAVTGNPVLVPAPEPFAVPRPPRIVVVPDDDDSSSTFDKGRANPAAPDPPSPRAQPGYYNAPAPSWNLIYGLNKNDASPAIHHTPVTYTRRWLGAPGDTLERLAADILARDVARGLTVPSATFVNV